MRRISVTQYTMDLARGGRVFTTCWLSASLGISILQMLLLAQAWQASQHALGPACLVSAWTLASLVGTRMRTAPQVWGGVCLACILLWLGGPALVLWWLPPSVVSQVPSNTAALALAALVLSTSSTAWLSQQRTWPTVGERAELVRSLVGLVIGLLVAWMLPTWAPLIALTCCLPLCTLDFLFSSCSPLPRPGGVACDGYLAHPFTNQLDVLLIASCFSELWHSQIKEYKSISRVYQYHTEHTLFIFSFGGS